MGVACSPLHLFVGIVLLHSASAVIVPCSIHALSVSKNGFVALLMDRPRERLLPLVVAEDRVRSGTRMRPSVPSMATRSKRTSCCSGFGSTSASASSPTGWSTRSTRAGSTRRSTSCSRTSSDRPRRAHSRTRCSSSTSCATATRTQRRARSSRRRRSTSPSTAWSRAASASRCSAADSTTSTS
jgi:hypothetical protein